MSDDQGNTNEIDVDGHIHKAGASDEPADGSDGEVEAHVYKVSSVRMDSPSNT